MTTSSAIFRRSRALVLTAALLSLACVWFIALSKQPQADTPTVLSSDAKPLQLVAPVVAQPRVSKAQQVVIPLVRDIPERAVNTDDNDYMKELQQLNEEKVSADDPRLIRIIKEHLIVPPSTKPYNLQNPTKTEYSGQGKDFLVQNTVKNLPDVGFFIECGAHNGEFRSSTLYFEKQKHWSGLLIEANPELFAQLQMKHRKAYSLNACLNTNPYPSIMRFNLQNDIGRLVESDLKEAYSTHHGFKIRNNTVEIQCFPLYSLLLAMGNPTVDYMGLDTEGTELSILKTVPWDKVDIRSMLVEHKHTPGGNMSMKQYLERNGYTTLKILVADTLMGKEK